MKKQPTFSLKDQLFNREKVKKIADELRNAYPDFEKKKFVRVVSAGFDGRELKERIVWIRENLHDFLPSDYREAVTILLTALPEELDPEKSDDDFGDFIYAPYSDFVAQYGCTKKDFAFSLMALKEMTKRFSVEDSIRYFLRKYPDETLSELAEWVSDKNYHVRRLVSEGTRPSLPWCGKIDLDQKKTIKLLDQLYTDNTRYVVRSVANHMNDIAKIDPQLAIKTLKRWKREGRQDKKELDYLISHALRTLVKDGNAEALTLLGYKNNPEISVKNFTLKKRSVKIGQAVEFSFVLDAKKDEKLMIDYMIRFADKNGELTRKKVFKIAQKALKKGQREKITKKHALKPMTTWALYPGSHFVGLQINGKKYPLIEFTLKT